MTETCGGEPFVRVSTPPLYLHITFAAANFFLQHSNTFMMQPCRYVNHYELLRKPAANSGWHALQKKKSTSDILH